MLILFLFLVCTGSKGLQVLDKNFWEQSASEDLKESLKIKLNTNIAKNVIIFIGDGMGPNTATAARIYSEGEAGYLTWERFPHVGAIKTYAADTQVPDSANTATALYTGVKTNRYTLGVDPSVKPNDCDGSIVEANRLVTIATLAQEAGKSTGIITTTRVTHATPGAMYARSANRDWECDSSFPAQVTQCKDIARQLIEDNPGKNLNVIMGGGRQILKANVSDLPEDPIILYDSCVRTDGRDLIAEWAQRKESEGARYAVVNNTNDLLNVDTTNTDFLLGIFYNNYLPYEHLRDKSEKGVPSLEEMTITAIKLLMKNKNGFLLMAEGGLIDLAHHDGKAHVALNEVIAFNNAINRTIKFLESAGILDETLVIVTSDHSHTLTISGYPAIGNNILGIAGKSNIDGIPYTTLGYANSKMNNYHYKAVNGSVVREDPSKVDTTSWDYGVQAAVLQDENTHGGNDVLVYAIGPYAHLFHCMHEQNYIATVIKYAARIGEYSSAQYAEQTSSATNILPSVILFVIIQSILFLK